jgi:hypothetical protein
MALALVTHAVKNPAKAAELKTALLELASEINALYPAGPTTAA